MFERRRMLAALGDAVLAPSIHNSQPWRFRVGGDGVAIVLDASVTPRLVDPVGRWALQSIGAVTAALELAIAARLGQGTETILFPDGDVPQEGPTAGGQAWDGRTLALVRPAAAPAGVVEARARLAAALPLRHTTREPLLGGAPSSDEVRSVVEATSVLSPVRGVALDEALGLRLLELTALADAKRVDDPAYLAEVQNWVDHAGKVGIPHGAGGVASAGGAFPGRDFSRSLSGRADWAGEATFEDPPFLFAVVSSGDTPRDQVLGGYGLLRATTSAAALGLGTGVLGQALEEADSRAEVDAAASAGLGEPVVVHQLLRLGHPAGELSAVHTQRRPLKDVLLD